MRFPERVRLFVFKPDGIGDFVLATGALRTFAKAYGEENLTLCVRTIIAPLARAQFPRATVLELPTAAKRRVVNLFARNLAMSLPLWLRLRRSPVDAAVCLRSMRNYLETFLFYSVKTRRFVACENLLLDGTKRTRAAVEGSVRRWFRAELVPYPAQAAGVPREIEAHRRVVSLVLGREVATDAVLPSLRAESRDDGTWICAPVTTLKAKTYPTKRWVEVLTELKPEAAQRKILLTGAPEDRPRLEELLAGLQSAGFSNAEVVLPPTLADYVDCIAGAELMLTVDTAAAHFATALDRRALILFSGLHAGMFAPWQRSDRQCWLRPEGLAPGQKWHAGIPPARAAAEVRRLLAAR